MTTGNRSFIVEVLTKELVNKLADLCAEGENGLLDAYVREGFKGFENFTDEELEQEIIQEHLNLILILFYQYRYIHCLLF